VSRSITPRIISRRGLMLLSEYRYIDRSYTGEMHYEGLPNDNLTGTTRSGMPRWTLR
jgi:LPS-assembly protein